MWDVGDIPDVPGFYNFISTPWLKKMSCSSTVQSIVAAKVNYFGDLKELGLLGWMGNTGLMARDLEGWSKEPAKKDGIQRGVHKEVFWKYVLPALSGVAGLSGVLEYFVLFVHDVYFRSFSVTHALNGILLLTASIGDLWPFHIIKMNLYWWDHLHRHTQSHHHTIHAASLQHQK